MSTNSNATDSATKTPADISADSEILFSRAGGAQHVVLNRPAALNALSHNMIKRLAAALAAWEKDASVSHIVFRGAGAKPFAPGVILNRLILTAIM